MLFHPIDICYETITDGLNMCGIHTVMLGSTSRRHSVCQRQPSVLFLTALNTLCNTSLLTEEIDPIAPALDWQYTLPLFIVFMKGFLFLEGITFHAHAP